MIVETGKLAIHRNSGVGHSIFTKSYMRVDNVVWYMLRDTVRDKFLYIAGVLNTGDPDDN